MHDCLRKEDGDGLYQAYITGIFLKEIEKE